MRVLITGFSEGGLEVGTLRALPINVMLQASYNVKCPVIMGRNKKYKNG